MNTRNEMDVLHIENRSLRDEIARIKRQLAENWAHHTSEHGECPYTLGAPSPEHGAIDATTLTSSQSPTDSTRKRNQLRLDPGIASKRGRYGVCSDAQLETGTAAREATSSTRIRASEVSAINESRVSHLQTALDPAVKKLPSSCKWRFVANKLIAITPTAENWWKEADKIGLGCILQNGDGVKFLLNKTETSLQILNFQTPETLEIPDGNKLLKFVSDYAHAAKQRSRSIGMLARMVNVQNFVVAGLCAVVSKILPRSKNEWRKHLDGLYHVTRMCFGPHLSEIYISRLWLTASRMIECLDWLAFQGWGHRSSELLIIWNLPLSKYVPLTENKDAFAYLKTELSSAKFTRNVAPRKESMALSYPQLFCEILEKQLSTYRISHILELRHAHFLKTLVNPWRFFMRSSNLDSEVAHAMQASQTAANKQIGKGVSSALVESTRAELAASDRHPDYLKYESIPFVYEALEDASAPAVRRVVDEWIIRPANVRQAARAIGIDIADTQIYPIVRANCGFRFKEQTPIEAGGYPLEGLAASQREGAVSVLIAMENLDSRNGCSVELRSGEHVCMNGNARVDFPGTGGGAGRVHRHRLSESSLMSQQSERLVYISRKFFALNLTSHANKHGAQLPRSAAA